MKMNLQVRRAEKFESVKQRLGRTWLSNTIPRLVPTESCATFASIRFAYRQAHDQLLVATLHTLIDASVINPFFVSFATALTIGFLQSKPV